MKDSSMISVYCSQKGKHFENAIQNTISNSMPLISLFFLYVAIKILHYTCHLHYFSAGWCSFHWSSWLSSLGFKVRDLGWSLDPWTVLNMNTNQKVICALAGGKKKKNRTMDCAGRFSLAEDACQIPDVTCGTWTNSERWCLWEEKFWRQQSPVLWR